MRQFFCLYVLFLFASVASAQSSVDTSKWTLGIGVGYYLPDDATAAYYNGQDNNRLLLLLQGFDEPRIRDALGGYDFELEEYAQDMAYNNVAAFELEMAYRFGQNWNVSLYFRNVTLTAAGIFTLRVQRVNQNNTPDPYLERANINGRERRSHLALGGGKRLYLNESSFYIPVEAGVDFNFIEVLENKVQIAGSTFNLPTFTNIQAQQGNNPITVGSGFFASTGIGYQLPSQYGFAIRGTFIQSNISVNDIVEDSGSIYMLSLYFSRTF